jgi:signal transduction histidine kinase
LYKIAQEAANNAVKHGKATFISLSLSALPDRLVLVIKNSGAPFPETIEAGHGMGLRIMKSRASVIGGSLEIKSNDGNGTIVTCALPLLNGARAARADLGAQTETGKSATLKGWPPDPSKIKPIGESVASFAP